MWALASLTSGSGAAEAQLAANVHRHVGLELLLAAVFTGGPTGFGVLVDMLSSIDDVAL